MVDGKTYVFDMRRKYCEILNLPPCTNVYKRSVIESTHMLQEEDDKRLSLGMPMPPQEEDKKGTKEDRRARRTSGGRME
jgi:hypothetical protein